MTSLSPRVAASPSLFGVVTFLGGVACLGGVVGCSSEPPPPPPPTEPSATAPDELAPGELPESPKVWAGLPLPVGLRAAELTPTYLRARGRVPLEAVANYLRSRVDAANVVTGPAKTVFDDVKVKRPRGKPVVPLESDAGGKEIVRIEVSHLRGETTVIARRELKPPFQEGLTDAERWAKTGLTPDGKPIDPNKFE